MMVELTPQLVLSGLQTAGLLIGILYYIFDMQNKREDQRLANTRQDLMLKSQEQALETRQIQLFLRILDRIWDDDIQEAYEVITPLYSNLEEFWQKYREDIKFQRCFFRWAYYWENSGMLVKLGYLPIEFVAASPSIAYNVIFAWENFKDVVYRFRELGSERARFEMWEHLYEELMKYIDEHP
jgi:hypothetical protein